MLRKNRLPLRRLSTLERIELAREQYYINVAISERQSRFFIDSAPMMNEKILRQAYKRVHEDRLLLALYETDEDFRKAVDAGEVSPSAAKEWARQLRRQSEEFQAKKSRAVAARHDRAARKRLSPSRGLQREIDSIYCTLCESG